MPKLPACYHQGGAEPRPSGREPKLPWLVLDRYRHFGLDSDAVYMDEDAAHAKDSAEDDLVNLELI